MLHYPLYVSLNPALTFINGSLLNFIPFVETIYFMLGSWSIQLQWCIRNFYRTILVSFSIQKIHVIEVYAHELFSTVYAKSWLIGKDPDAGTDWGQEEKGTTEDEMAGWHHQLDGHEFE